MKLAAIRIRGITGVRHDITLAMESLCLSRKFSCVLLEDTPIIRGQIQKCKDFITYGPISEEVEKELLEKRGKKDKNGAWLPVMHLHPPRGGFERRGVKMPFTNGGALGNREEKISDLIKKML